MKNDFQIIDPSYLEDMTGDDINFRKEVIRLFEKQVTEHLEIMKNLYAEKAFEELQKAIHKAKVSILVMGITEMVDEIRKIESLDKTLLFDYDMQKFIYRFEIVCLKAIDETKIYINNLEKLKLC